MKKALIITLLLAGAALARHEYYDEFSRAAETIDEVVIDCPVGKITCEPAGDNNLTIHVKKIIFLSDESEAKEYADACKAKFEVNNKTLNMKIDFLPAKRYIKGVFDKLYSGNLNDDLEILIKVSLPPGTRLLINTASADIFAADLKNDIIIDGSSADIIFENVNGNCEIDLSSGDLEARNFKGDISLDGSSSDVDLIGIEGDIEISTTSGDGVIEDVEGNIKMRTSSGDIKICNLLGNLDHKSTSGDLGAENISGSVEAGSSSGTINLDRLTNTEGIFHIETTSGDVYIEVGTGFGGDLELETISGDIHSQLGLTFNKYSESYLAGSIGQGAGKINIETSSGDIILGSY